MRTTFLLLLVLQLSACAISNKTNSGHSSSPEVEDMVVSNKKDYSNITDVKVDLYFQGRTFEEGPTAKYKILGVDDRNKKGLLVEGQIDEKGKIETGVYIPLHYKDLVLQVDYRSRTYEMPLKKRPNISQIIWMDYEGLF